METWIRDFTGASHILDVYRNHSYTKVSSRAGTGTGLTYNREHTWPNSLGFGSTTGNLGLPNAPYTDTHMLYASDTTYNADRGNKPMDMDAHCAEPQSQSNARGSGTRTMPSWATLAMSRPSRV